MSQTLESTAISYDGDHFCPVIGFILFGSAARLTRIRGGIYNPALSHHYHPTTTSCLSNPTMQYVQTAATAISAIAPAANRESIR